MMYRSNKSKSFFFVFTRGVLFSSKISSHVAHIGAYIIITKSSLCNLPNNCRTWVNAESRGKTNTYTPKPGDCEEIR